MVSGEPAPAAGRRRIVVGLIGTVSALVLLFSYHTSLGSGTAPGAGDPNGSAGGDGATPATGSTPGASAGSSSSSGSSGSAGTFTGDRAQTQWGPVQVKITVQAGKITKSEAVVYPDGNFRDQQINAFALPQLNAEVVETQSGTIDAVSGATVTSDGYLRSLQSAIDQAHL